MIVIPMAGLSSRFSNAGFKLPKYMLEAHGLTLFEHSVLSFKHFFKSEKFLFICLNTHETVEFIHEKVNLLGISDYEIACLEMPTSGQAETVFLGLKKSEVDYNERIFIFNIDTFRPGFQLPKNFDVEKVDGYLETFLGSGSNWSNVVPSSLENFRVAMTAEKKELSKFCCTGLYMWKNSHLYFKAYQKLKNTPLSELDGKEHYIAPMYNYLIQAGGNVRFSVIDTSQVIFCGVPDEYNEFLLKDYRYESNLSKER
ncbi:capsular biosynthesis protein [Alteromonas sp. IB21]|uniref:capsular biosynthesis protein n=1 Tax=Alteromonas sp. IB21 TaxID=2779369 RepID=UPI0018E8A013|nr:capsular biosynthesis protein [Alteromonas sp. IB21]MBJ2130616.1 capsular biosynthesis protein [Alteromonas sp. IB21]